MITCTFIFLAISTTLCFTISIFAAYKFDKHKKVAINFLNDSIASSGHTIENMVVEKDEATYLQKLKDKGSIPINIDVKSRPNRKVEITLKASIGLASAVEQSVEKKQLEENKLKVILRKNDILVSIILATMILGMVLILLTGTNLTKPISFVEIIGIVAASIIGILPSLLWVFLRRR